MGPCHDPPGLGRQARMHTTELHKDPDAAGGAPAAAPSDGAATTAEPAMGCDGSARLHRRLILDIVRAQRVGTRAVQIGAVVGSDGMQAAVLPSLQGPLSAQGSAPLSLQSGSVDSLLVLDTPWLAHAPLQRVADAARVVRPGGRVLLACRSAEHRAALGNVPADPGIDERPTVTAWVEAARRHGLVIRAVIPYGAFLSDGSHSRWLGDWPMTAYARRLLSWLSDDPHLLELALLIEQEIVAHLSTRVTDRFVALFDRREDVTAADAWLRRHSELDDCLRRSPLDRASLQKHVPGSLPALRVHVSALLSVSLRARRLFDAVVAPLLDPTGLTWSDLVEPALASYFVDVARHRDLDSWAMVWSRQAACEVPGMAANVQHQGVPLGRALEYSLVEPLLTQGFRRFTGVRT